MYTVKQAKGQQMYTLEISTEIDLTGSHSDLFAVFDSDNAFAIIDENADGLFYDVDPDNGTPYAFCEVAGDQQDYAYGSEAVQAFTARWALVVNSVNINAVSKQLTKLLAS